MQLNSATRIESNIVESIRSQALRRPEALAYTFLIDGERQEAHLTFADLDRKALAIAGRLQQEIGVGERAILVYPSGLDFITAFLGCLYAGVVAVPVPEPLSERHIIRLKSVIQDAQTSVVLTTQPMLAAINRGFQNNAAVQALQWLATDNIEPQWAASWREPDFDERALAFMQYTSGSTGTPRGVMVSHGNLTANSRMLRSFFESDENTVFVSWLPLFHDMGLIAKVLQSAYVGARCILMSPFAFLQKPARWLQAISRYGGEISGAPDFAYALCAHKVTPAQRDGLDLRRWRIAFNGAEPVRAATLRAFAESFAAYGFRWDALFPAYGMAEATLFISAGHRNEGSTRGPTLQQLDAQALARHQVVPVNRNGDGLTAIACGRHDWGDQRVKIVDPNTCAECPPAQIGEIWIAGSHVAQGYWNKAAETEEVFHACIAGSGEGPFLRTGDLGFLRDGQLTITGRIKDLIIIDGRNHYPQDVELTVENVHPAVRKGCTAAFSVERAGQERLVVVAELRPVDELTPPIDPDEIAQGIRRAVSAEHGVRIDDLAFIKARTIHKTSSGKIQRRACKNDYLANALVHW